MGLFKKKPDPIGERTKDLNHQIAAIEAEIQKLAEQENASPPAVNQPVLTVPPLDPGRGQFSNHPRLRSTARPRGPNAPLAAQEPVFEEVGQDRIKSESKPAPSANHHELGVRKDDLTSTWERLKNHFRGPAASNPKLVHYLSAGSIQGLRPLRYEKRVARNRFILLAVFLVFALWAIIAFFVGRN